jgi:hypothetical protein
LNLTGLAVALLALAAGEPAPREAVERFFKALEKKDAASAAALVQSEATIAKLGEEKPFGAGSAAVVETFLDRFKEFPKWSTKLGERIASGPWVAAKERVTLESGEKPREALYLFQVREGEIRRVWTMEGDGEGAGEGAASLLVEKWNEHDLPRFIGLFEGGAGLFELPSGERLAAGEDELRDRFEKSFVEGTPRIEVVERMSLSPWTVYRSRSAMEADAPVGEALTIFESRGGLVRRVWYLRSGPALSRFGGRPDAAAQIHRGRGRARPYTQKANPAASYAAACAGTTSFKAVRNASMSPRVPIETRSQSGIDGNLRPTRIRRSRKERMIGPTSEPTWIIRKFVCDGM